MLRPATPLFVFYFTAFILLLLSTISTPIVKSIPLGSATNSNTSITYHFGVFGWCTEGQPATCSGIDLGYNPKSVVAHSSNEVAIKKDPGSGTKHEISNLLIVHPIAAFFTLVCTGMAASAHLRSPAHSPRFLLALLILSFPTLFITLLAFLVDILLFIPTVSWGGWIVLVATIIQTVCTVLTCAMRRTLVNRKARKRRIAENADMNGDNYKAQRAEEERELQIRQMHDAQGAQFMRADSPPPLDGKSMSTTVSELGKPQFIASEYERSRPSTDEDRSPLSTAVPGHGMVGIARERSRSRSRPGESTRDARVRDDVPMVPLQQDGEAQGTPLLHRHPSDPRADPRFDPRWGSGGPSPTMPFSGRGGRGGPRGRGPPPPMYSRGRGGYPPPRGGIWFGPMRGRGGRGGSYPPPRGGRGFYRGNGPPPPGFFCRGPPPPAWYSDDPSRSMRGAIVAGPNGIHPLPEYRNDNSRYTDEPDSYDRSGQPGQSGPYDAYVRSRSGSGPRRLPRSASQSSTPAAAVDTLATAAAASDEWLTNNNPYHDQIATPTPTVPQYQENNTIQSQPRAQATETIRDPASFGFSGRRPSPLHNGSPRTASPPPPLPHEVGGATDSNGDEAGSYEMHSMRSTQQQPPSFDGPAQPAVPRRHRTSSGAYYEDVSPEFAGDEIIQPPFPTNNARASPHGRRRSGPNASAPGISGAHGLPSSLVPGGALAPPQDAYNSQNPSATHPMHSEGIASSDPNRTENRSPAISEVSNFTSISQRGINPNWNPSMGMSGQPLSRGGFSGLHPAAYGRAPGNDSGHAGGPGVAGSSGSGAPRESRWHDQDVLSANPDFMVPGVSATSNRPGHSRGMSSHHYPNANV